MRNVELIFLSQSKDIAFVTDEIYSKINETLAVPFKLVASCGRCPFPFHNLYCVSKRIAITGRCVYYKYELSIVVNENLYQRTAQYYAPLIILWSVLMPDLYISLPVSDHDKNVIVTYLFYCLKYQ